jgi:zinc transport system substrate-binding protein
VTSKNSCFPSLTRSFILQGLFLFILCFGCLCIQGCQSTPTSQTNTSQGNTSDIKPSETVSYLVTIAPLQAILQELTEGRATSTRLLEPNVSPHTAELRPSDIQRASKARAIFYVSDHLDGWAAQLPVKTKVDLSLWLKAVSQYDPHPEEDPHFWMDPYAVAAIVPAWTHQLEVLDPAGKTVYQQNQAKFLKKLAVLSAWVDAKLAPLQGKAVLFYHPSFHYWVDRYHLNQIGVIENSGGQVMSAKQLYRLSKTIEEIHAKQSPKNTKQNLKEQKAQQRPVVLLSEPQLPTDVVQSVAQSLNIAVVPLDPMGGVPGRDTYEELIQYNTLQLWKALQTP